MENKMKFNRILDNIEKNASQNTQKNEDDYIDDEGILVCGHCHTRKQIVAELFGKIRKPYCLCKCASEKLKAEEEKMKKIDLMIRIKNLRKAGFPDGEMTDYTFKNDDRANEKLSSIAKRYVENFARMFEDGKGLIFYGNVGSGKTFISACIANALIDKGRPCMVTNFARLVNTLGNKFEGKQDYLDGLNKFSLLVIDDLAAERDTEYMNEIIYNIIDSRYRSRKPLIVTTNLNLEELTNPTDIKKQRVYSRLLEMCLPIEVKDENRRLRKTTNNYLEYKELLGL